MSVTRRLFLRQAAAGAATSVVMVPATATAAPDPNDALAALIATFETLVPEGARIQIYASRQHCRVEFYKTFQQPVHPKLPGRMMDVEWITGSYRLTDNGWEPEGYYSGRRE